MTVSSSLLYKTKIAGLGSYLPENTLSNKDLEKMMDTSDEWIRERTGISTRHMAAEGQNTSDLALVASQRALEMAKMSAQELDMIIFATVTPDHIMPNTACLLQEKLKANNCMAFDLSAACSGWIYSLSIADQFIKTGPLKNILVVGAEVLHRFIDYEDRTVCILFGDGAGAAVVQRTPDLETSSIWSHHNHAEGALGDLLCLPAGGSAMPLSQQALDEKKHFVSMKGREIFKNAVRTMGKACEEALIYNQLSVEDIDWVIPHQANVRIIEAVAKQAQIPMEKVIVEIQDMGNTSAATIPVSFDRAVRDGRIQRGQKVLLTAFGGGLTSGSLLLQY